MMLVMMMKLLIIVMIIMMALISDSMYSHMLSMIVLLGNNIDGLRLYSRLTVMMTFTVVLVELICVSVSQLRLRSDN